MTNNYFHNCKTTTEAKALWKALAKKYHPDMLGGSTEKMQELNKQYFNFCERLNPNYKNSQKYNIDITEYSQYLEQMFPGQPWILFFQAGPIPKAINDLLNGNLNNQNLKIHTKDILKLLSDIIII